MKIKNLLSSICAVSCVALSFVACSDYDNGFTDKEIAFQEAFKQRFGVIDPEQDWNLATRGTLNVNLKEETNVKVYSSNPISEGAVLMADYNVSSPTALGFDMPEGTKEVFVQASNDRGVVINGYYSLTDVVEYGQGKDIDISNVSVNPIPMKFSVFDKPKNRSYELYWVNNIPNSHDENSNVPKPGKWKIGDYRHILDTDGVFAEGVHNWEKYVKPGILERDVVYTITDEDGNGKGRMSVTLNYYCTNTTNNQFAYFYWTDDDLDNNKAYPEEKDFVYTDDKNNTSGKIKLYCLIKDSTDPNNGYLQYRSDSYANWGNFIGNGYNPFTETNVGDNAQVLGTTFQLIYFDKDENPSLDFPAGTHIGFAVLMKKENIDEAYDSNQTDHVWFSLQDMNVSSTSYGQGGNYNNENFPAAATFRAAGQTYLGFEDWPENEGADLNDLMFWVNGDFEEEKITELVTSSDEEQSWMLAYEDLGNSFDWDFNDVVLRVAYVSGNDYITITPMAAGGTLASYVKFNGKNVRRKFIDDSETEYGEIHQLMGAAATTSGNYAPINTEQRNDAASIKCNFIDYDYNGEFTMTELGNTEDMGGITLHVNSPDGKEAVIAYKRNKEGENSNVPEVLCLPGSWTDNEDGSIMMRRWRWPVEFMGIDEAYSEFEGWVANYKDNIDWYKNFNAEKCVKGTFERKILGNGITSLPKGSGDNITKKLEGVSDDENWVGIPSTILSKYKSCKITLLITEKASWANLIVYDDYRNGHTTYDILKEEQVGDDKMGIYTITLSEDDMVKFPNGIWFYAITIDEIAIDGEKKVDEDGEDPGKDDDDPSGDARITMDIGTKYSFSSMKTENDDRIDYFVDLSKYKLPSDFTGGAKITIFFTGTWNDGNGLEIYYINKSHNNGSDYIKEIKNNVDKGREDEIQNEELKNIIDDGGFYVRIWKNSWQGTIDNIDNVTIEIVE